LIRPDLPGADLLKALVAELVDALP
jgi:hypothetical protein